jgi:hypothetical protein
MTRQMGWAERKRSSGTPKMAAKTKIGEIPPCLIFIDKEGHWFHKGAEMIHREFIRLFYRHMELDPQDRYVINWKGQRCWVDVEDTAFIVRRVSFKDGIQARNAPYVLHLSDDTIEPLAPDTLFVGEGNVLYCKVKNRSFPARFNRAAYYQLAEYIEQDGDTYYLPFNGEKINIT